MSLRVRTIVDVLLDLVNCTDTIGHYPVVCSCSNATGGQLERVNALVPILAINADNGQETAGSQQAIDAVVVPRGGANGLQP